MLALFMHFILKLCSVQLHLPMLLLANFVSIPIEVTDELLPQVLLCELCRLTVATLLQCSAVPCSACAWSRCRTLLVCTTVLLPAVAGCMHTALHEIWGVCDGGPKARCCPLGYQRYFVQQPRISAERDRACSCWMADSFTCHHCCPGSNTQACFHLGCTEVRLLHQQDIQLFNVASSRRQLQHMLHLFCSESML